MIQLLELLYVPAFFLAYYSLFIESFAIATWIPMLIASVSSLILAKRNAVNNRIIDGIVTAGLFYSHLIPLWSGVFFMLLLLAMPNSYTNYSRLSFLFRGIAFPALMAIYFAGWNAYGLAVLVYLITLLALSLKGLENPKHLFLRRGGDVCMADLSKKGWRKIGKVKRSPNTICCVDSQGNVWEKPRKKKGKSKKK